MIRASFLSILIFFSFLTLILASVFACNAKNSGVQAPMLEFKSLSLNGKRIAPYHEIEISDIDRIEAGDIKATFAYSKIEGEVELPLYVKGAPLRLKKNVPVRVEVYVLPKQDEYQGWKTSFNAILK